jgi:hypothetical protein
MLVKKLLFGVMIDLNKPKIIISHNPKTPHWIYEKFITPNNIVDYIKIDLLRLKELKK